MRLIAMTAGASRRARIRDALPRLAAMLALLLFSLGAAAHPGGLDSAGCHSNRSTGEHHCHRDSASSGDNDSHIETELQGRVVAVTDGDTIKILDAGNTTLTVRLNGIDAPERAQPFGSVSRKNLESMVAGRQVIVRHIKYDRYGRTLGNVWVQPRDCSGCGKTLHVNHAQILAGMAWWYRYYAGDQTEEDRGRFESAEGEAMARKWGLWADPDPVPPWVWRRR
jgi:endonuclease YncB( thermonuclease family)